MSIGIFTVIGSLDGVLIFDITNDYLDILPFQCFQIRGFGLGSAWGSKDGHPAELGPRGEDGGQDERADLARCTEEKYILGSHCIRFCVMYKKEKKPNASDIQMWGAGLLINRAAVNLSMTAQTTISKISST
jgi:hypothetical protein